MKLQKITEAKKPRRYDDACGTAHALDLIGERWALLVMRELMLGPKRFSDIRGDLPGISANVLTQRLEGLGAAGLLTRSRLPPPANAQVYELTQWGYEAEPIIQTMGRWAARSPLHDPTLPISASSIMLSFRTMFDSARAQGFSARVGFRFPSDRFVARIHDGRLEIARGEGECNAVFVGSPAPLAAAVYGGQPLEALIQSGEVAIEGDLATAKRFVTLFPLPSKVAPAG